MIRIRSSMSLQEQEEKKKEPAVVPVISTPPPAINKGAVSRLRMWSLWLLIGSALCYALIYSNANIAVQYKKKHKDPSKEVITIVMNTFKRHDMMTDAIEYYSSCNLIKHIYIVWSEPGGVPDRISAKYESSRNPSVEFLVQTVDSLNNRFLPLSRPHTEAIFSVDDDMRVTCEDLVIAYESWIGSKMSIVGFMPRLHLRSTKDPTKLDYRCWWRVWWHGRYSIILTKAAIFHEQYLKMYSESMPASIRALVDEERNCEDIAMQFLISNATALPPIYVRGALQDLGALNGISTSQNVISAKHMGSRSDCLNKLVSAYGKNPLVSSHIIVNAASNKWTNAPSTWLEYISSDLWKF